MYPVESCRLRGLAAPVPAPPSPRKKRRTRPTIVPAARQPRSVRSRANCSRPPPAFLPARGSGVRNFADRYATAFFRPCFS